jgi:hypothetical protein
MVRLRHHRLTAEALDGLGDPRIVRRNYHPIHTVGGPHGITHVLDQRSAGLGSERFPGESGGRVTRGDNRGDGHAVALSY